MASEEDLALFFAQKPEALGLYQVFAERLLAELPSAQIKVQKTQISFYNQYPGKQQFACVSFLPVRRAKERPAVFIVVTFGLDHPLASPRIDAVTEPYPNRWTHHVLISAAEEIDGALLAWVKEASLFAARKRGSKRLKDENGQPKKNRMTDQASGDDGAETI